MNMHSKESILIPTFHTTRVQRIIALLANNTCQSPTLVCGACGVGKSLLGSTLAHVLRKSQSDPLPFVFQLCHRSKLEVLADAFTSKLQEHVSVATESPLIVFIDDLHVPRNEAIESSGVDAIREFVRTLVEKRQYLDPTTLCQRAVRALTMQCSISAPRRYQAAERRLYRHFIPVVLCSPSFEMLGTIFAARAEAALRNEADLTLRLFLTRCGAAFVSAWNASESYRSRAPILDVFNARCALTFLGAFENMLGVLQDMPREERRSIQAILFVKGEMKRMLSSLMESKDDRNSVCFMVESKLDMFGWEFVADCETVQKKYASHLVFDVAMGLSNRSSGLVTKLTMDTPEGTHNPSLESYMTWLEQLQLQIEDELGVPAATKLVLTRSRTIHLLHLLQALRQPNGHALLVGGVEGSCFAIASLLSRVYGSELIVHDCAQGHSAQDSQVRIHPLTSVRILLWQRLRRGTVACNVTATVVCKACTERIDLRLALAVFCRRSSKPSLRACCPALRSQTSTRYCRSDQRSYCPFGSGQA